MALYNITFTLNDKKHVTSGTSSYPTKKNLEANDFSREIALENAFIFIGEYIKTHKLNGNVNPCTVEYYISLD